MGISTSWDSGRASSSADSTLTLSVIWDHPRKEWGNQKYIKEAPHLPQGVEWANYFIFINKTLLEHRHTVHVHIILPTTTARLCDGNRDHMSGKEWGNNCLVLCRKSLLAPVPQILQTQTWYNRLAMVQKERKNKNFWIHTQQPRREEKLTGLAVFPGRRGKIFSPDRQSGNGSFSVR